MMTPSNLQLHLLFTEQIWITLNVRLDGLNEINTNDSRFLIRFADTLGLELLFITLYYSLRQQLFYWNYYRSVDIPMFLNIG